MTRSGWQAIMCGTMCLLHKENHVRVLRIEEGRTRPSHAMPRRPYRFQPWIKPVTAKSASSQGGALATPESVHKPTVTELKT
jgi:hypothetical protein